MTVEDHTVAINKWTSRAIPILIVGLSGYVAYVVVQKICVEYLIDPARHGFLESRVRSGLAIPILVFFFLLLIIYLACYIRIMQTIRYNPGYTEQRAHPPSRSQSVGSKREGSIKSGLNCVPEKTPHRPKEPTYPVLNRTAILTGAASAPPGIEQFLRKDVFICDPQGLPLFCDMCNNWKPDRTHHCSEVERCVRRMDHFCPWVGGIVSETNIKFFIQFLFYAAAWGMYTLGFCAWACYDRSAASDASQRARREVLNDPQYLGRDFAKMDGQWIAATALTGLLGAFFAGGMFLSTLYNATINRSTNESVIKRSYNIAVRLNSRQDSKYRGPTVTYPLQGTPHPNEFRTYAIIQSMPNDNIWSTSVLGNLKSVLGESYVDWILPLSYPSCTTHGDPKSDYPLGRDFERLCREHGID